jgi:uncharacterized protein (TIGR03437 family)
LSPIADVDGEGKPYMVVCAGDGVQLELGRTVVLLPVSLGSAIGSVYLLRLGMDIRVAPQWQQWQGTVAAGVSLPVQYAGTQGQYLGLDQINVTVFRSKCG